MTTRAENPTTTLEQTAASLIDHAIRIRNQGQEGEIPVYSIVRKSAPILARGYNIPGLSKDYNLGEKVDISLRTNHEMLIAPYRSNPGDSPEYRHWANRSGEHEGIFTVFTQALVCEGFNARIVASRLVIAVSRKDLTDYANLSEFLNKASQKTA